MKNKITKKSTLREVLQVIGTDLLRDGFNQNVHVAALMSEYSPIQYHDGGRVYDKQEYPSWIITDTRFPNELQAVKDRGGLIIRISRDLEKSQCNDCGWQGLTSQLEGANMNNCPDCNSNDYIFPYIKNNLHESETALDNAEFDYIVDNNGTILKLIEKVKQILIKENIL